MSMLILEENDGQWLLPVSSKVTSIIGTSGIDKVAIPTGAKVNLKAGFSSNDTIYIQGDSTQFSVSSSGNTVTLTDGNGSNIVLKAGTAAQKLIFGDGFLNLQISGAIKVGDQTISGTTPVKLTAAVDTLLNSDAQFSGGGTTPVSDHTVVGIDVGTLTTPITFNAASGNFNYTDNANTITNVVINGFTSNDKITVSNALSNSYQFSSEGTNVTITNNNDGIINQITLTGVISNGALVYDEVTFEGNLGFNAFNVV